MVRLVPGQFLKDRNQNNLDFAEVTPSVQLVVVFEPPLANDTNRNLRLLPFIELIGRGLSSKRRASSELSEKS